MKKTTELKIMLKRQVLKELIFDPDYNQFTNIELFGKGNHDSKAVQTSLVPTKT